MPAEMKAKQPTPSIIRTASLPVHGKARCWAGYYFFMT